MNVFNLRRAVLFVSELYLWSETYHGKQRYDIHPMMLLRTLTNPCLR